MRKHEENVICYGFVPFFQNIVNMVLCKLIRDRLGVGLADTKLSERMQLDKDLMLDKAISMARQSEEITRQQTCSCGDRWTKESCSVDRVAFKGKPQYRKSQMPRKERETMLMQRNPSSVKNVGKVHQTLQTSALLMMSCRGCGKEGRYKPVRGSRGFCKLKPSRNSDCRERPMDCSFTIKKLIVCLIRELLRD